MDHFQNHLVFPMQCCMDGIQENEVPTVLADNPYEYTNDLLINDLLDSEFPFIIVLYLRGVTSYSTSRKPIIIHWNDWYIPHIQTMAEYPLWDYGSYGNTKKEEVIINYRVHVIDWEFITREKMVTNLVMKVGAI